MRARSRVLTVTNLRRFTSIALVWGSLAATARAQEPVDVGKLLAILDANVQRTFTCRHSLVEVLAEDPTRDEEVRRRLEAAETTAPADANFVADYVYTASGSRLVGSFVVHRNALHGEGSAWVSLSDGERTLWVTGNGATVRLYREYNIGGAGCLVTFFLGAWGPDHAATRMRQAIQDGALRGQRQADGTITAAMDFREGVGNREVTWELGFDPESQRVVSVRRFPTDLPDSLKGGFWVATFDPTNGLPRTGWSVAHWGRYTSKRYLRFHRFAYEDLALAPDDVLRLAADVLADKPDDLQGIAPTAYAEHLDAEIQRLASATVDAFPRRPHALAPRLRPEELVWPSLADFRGGREGGDRVDPEAPRTRRAHAALAFLAGFHTRTSAPLVAAFEMAPSRDLSFAEVPRLAADLGVPLQAVELDAGTASLLTAPFLLSLPAIADTPAHIAVGLPRGTAGVRVWRPPGSASEGLALPTTRCLVSPTDLAHLRATQVAQQEAARTAKATSIAVASVGTGAGLALAYLLWRRRPRGALVSATLAVALGWWLWPSGSTAPTASPPAPSKVEAPTATRPIVASPAVVPAASIAEPPPRIVLPARNPGDLAGLTVDAETNAPLAGVEVELAVDLATLTFTPATMTRADGAFAIPAGAWPDPCSVRFARDGYRTQTVPYSGEGDLGVVRLAPSPPLRVRVLRADDGTPLPDLSVKVGPTGPRLLFVETRTTDAAGDAVFVRAPDDGMRVRVQLAGGTFGVTLPPRPGPEPVLILVPGERRVQVTVVDAQTRAPLAGARLQRPDAGMLACDDAGTCTFPLLAGTSTVVRLDAAGYFGSETLIDARATTVVVEARPTCTIRGRVDTEVGVRLERTASSGPALATRLPDGALAADGTFEWRDVPALSHLGVRALVDSVVAASTSLRTPAGGETATLPPMRIEPLARVRVQVEGAGPGPVGLVFTVRDAQRDTKVSHGGWYGSRGEHVLTLPDGRLLLAARQTDGGSARTEFDVPPRGDLRVVLHLEPGVDVAGALRLDGGTAAPACEISCQPLEPGLPARTVWTDADGRFVLRSLPPGRYQVSVRASHCSPPGYAYESATRELGPGERAFELSVPKLGGEIVGRITGVPTERTAHGIVHAIDRDGRRHPGRLEPDLRFAIPVPARGVFRIEAVSLLVPGGGKRWTAARDDVAPGADVSLAAVLR